MIGPRADAIAAIRAAQDNPYRCPQPEEGVKQHALGLALAAVHSQPPEVTHVSVEANGSNYVLGMNAESNQVRVIVRPVEEATASLPAA